MNCPKCGNKLIEDKCPFCKTTKQDILTAVNKPVRKMNLKERQKIVFYTNNIPLDVSRKKLILYSIFLGLFGVHCMYVGRYLRGCLIPLLFLIGFLLALLIQETSAIYDVLHGGIIGGLVGVSLFMWWWDILVILFKKFKIPVCFVNDVYKV